MVKDIIVYYEHPGKGYSKRYAIGQFYWAIVPIIPDSPIIPRVNPGGVVSLYDICAFKPEQNQPDPELGTKSDELLAVFKCQVRPVIILAPKVHQPWKSMGKQAGETYLVAPMYTIWDKVSSRYKYEREFIWHTIAYYYNSVFYLESSEEYGIKESIVRFDKVCSLHTSWLLRPWAVQLAPEALDWFKRWFRYYLTDWLSKKYLDDIGAFREALIENNEEAREFIKA